MLTLMTRGVFAACLLLLQAPAIRFDSARNLFILQNWTGAAQTPSEKWNEAFSIAVDAPNVPDLLGSYRIEEGVLVFAPRYPVQPGVSYRAVARVPGTPSVVTIFSIPKTDVKPTTVVDRVYPLAEIRAAHRYLENKEQFGKVIVKP